MVRCRCKGGSKLLPCCNRKSSRGRSFNSRNTSRNTPSRSRRGVSLPDPRSSGSASRKLKKFGKTLEQIGLAQYTNSYLSMPRSSGLIWTGVEKGQAFDVRSSQYGYPEAEDMRKNPHKYDFRPKGEALNFEGRQSAVPNHGQRKLKGREAHWARRPKHKYGPNAKQSPYSVPSPDEIYHHRKSQKRKGQFKMATGTSLRLLGNGLLVYQFGNYAYWLYEDPSDETAVEIVSDLTMYDEVVTYIIDPIIQMLDPGRAFSAS